MDGLFGQIEGWLRDFLKKAGSRIATIDEMEKVLRTYASRATQQRTHFVVVRWEPETKPLGRYIFPQPEFQISKTYCLLLQPGNPRLVIRNTSLEDHTFVDAFGQGQRKSYPKIDWEDLTDREWRRGYFSNTRWNKKKPAHGDSDTIMKRFEDHKSRRMLPPNLEEKWARTARKQANKLLRRRERWNHKKSLATASESSSSSSSESSSSDKTSEG